MEKIKLFAKKNNEEKKDNRKLIEKIGDWFNDEENLTSTLTVLSRSMPLRVLGLS